MAYTLSATFRLSRDTNSTIMVFGFVLFFGFSFFQSHYSVALIYVVCDIIIYKYTSYANHWHYFSA